MLPVFIKVWSSIIVPGFIITFAAIQQLLPTLTSLVSRSKVSILKLWFPVQKYTPWEIHVLLPIVTLAILSIQTFSPIQEVFPISNFDQCKVSDKVEQLDEMLRLAEKNIRAQLNFLNLTEEVKNKTTKVLSHFLAKNNFQNVIIRFEE